MVKNEKIKNAIFWNILKITFGLFLFVFLINKVGVDKIVILFYSVNPFYLVIAIIINLLAMFTEAVNIRIFYNVLKRRIGFLKMFKYYLISSSIGLFTPGKLGQFSMLYLFKKEGIKMGEGTAILLMDKIITLFSLSIIVAIGLFFFLSQVDAFKYSLLIICGGILTYFFLIHKHGRFFIKNYILGKHYDKFEGVSQTLSLFYRDHFDAILINFYITMAKWILTSFIILFFFYSIGIKVDFLYIFLITPVGVLVSLIPISINGIGIREYAVVILYEIVGVDGASVIAVYVLNLIVNYVVGLISIILFLQEFKNIKVNSSS
jgi:uncharacterized protein (TIRG00374 family)